MCVCVPSQTIRTDVRKIPSHIESPQTKLRIRLGIERSMLSLSFKSLQVFGRFASEETLNFTQK